MLTALYWMQKTYVGIRSRTAAYWDALDLLSLLTYISGSTEAAEVGRRMYAVVGGISTEAWDVGCMLWMLTDTECRSCRSCSNQWRLLLCVVSI